MNLPLIYLAVWSLAAYVERTCIKKATQENFPRCFKMKNHGLVVVEVMVCYLFCFVPLVCLNMHHKQNFNGLLYLILFLSLIAIGNAFGQSLLGHRMILIQGILPQSEHSRHKLDFYQTIAFGFAIIFYFATKSYWLPVAYLGTMIVFFTIYRCHKCKSSVKEMYMDE